MEQWLPQRELEGDSETLTIRGPEDMHIEQHQRRRITSTDRRLLRKWSRSGGRRAIQHALNSSIGVQLLDQMVRVDIIKIDDARHVLVLRAILGVAENGDDLTIGRP